MSLLQQLILNLHLAEVGALMSHYDCGQFGVVPNIP
jgi:hypothetical protein